MKQEKEEPSVGIAIVNYNGKDDVIELIDSLNKIDYKNYFIYLVDNFSKDGSQELFTKKYKRNKKIKLIFNKENLGLSGGFNIALDFILKDKLDYSFIMNNDMVVKKNFLSILIGKINSNNKIAAVGPRIYFYEDKKRIWNTGVYFKLKGFKNLDQFKLDKDSFQEDLFVDALDGAYLIRNSILFKIGPLENDFFIMHEMTFWCLKARKFGFKILVVPSSKIWHKVSRTLKHMSKTSVFYGTRNWILLLRRTQNKFNYILGLIIYSFLFIPRFIYSLFRKKKFYLKIRIKGLIEGVLYN